MAGLGRGARRLRRRRDHARSVGRAWSWAALLPVVGAFAAALRDIITRRLSARETSGAIMFYSMALMVACASLSAPFGWRWPDPLDLLLFLAVGFLVGGAHTLMI